MLNRGLISTPSLLSSFSNFSCAATVCLLICLFRSRTLSRVYGGLFDSFDTLEVFLGMDEGKELPSIHAVL